MSNLATQVTIVVIVHAVISALHGLAHLLIPVPLSLTQALFIGGVITALPIIAMILVWKELVQRAVTLLLLSMTGSLLFGLYIAPEVDRINTEDRNSYSANSKHYLGKWILPTNERGRLIYPACRTPMPYSVVFSG